MTSNVKLYCRMIDIVEKKKQEALKVMRRNNTLSSEQGKALLQKYDELLLEKYKKLEEMIEKDSK